MPEGPDSEAPEIISLKEECIGFIEDELHQGYGLDQIRKDLIEEGFPQEIIEFSANWVEQHNKVSRKDKEKEVSKDPDEHVKRRFHLPVFAIAGLIIGLLAIFFITGVDQDSGKQAPAKIDVFLYENLGVNPSTSKVAGTNEIYSRDEITDTTRAQALLDRNSDNKLLGSLKLSEAVSGVKKKATVFNIVGGGLTTKTLVEITFQPTQDVKTLKIVESIPKTMATSDQITLTQGGVIAEKDPVLVFTFDNAKKGKALQAVYVVEKDLKEIDTMTFAAEPLPGKEGPSEEAYCGDGKCVEGETYMSCCQDCGCPSGFTCQQGSCAPAVQVECQEDKDCDDNNAATIDTCGGSPKKCQHNMTTACAHGDAYCPGGCTSAEDSDCLTLEAASTETATGNLTANTTANATANATGTTTSNQTANATSNESAVPTGPVSPELRNVTVSPNNVSIGQQITIAAIVTDANGQDDIEKVWWSVLELAQSHGETGELTASSGGTLYTATATIGEHYLTGWYHVRVFARDKEGNQKREGTTFQVIGNSTS